MPRGRVVRSVPLLFSRWPTGAGWGWRRREPGDRDLSGELLRLWPPYLSFPLLLPPRASAAAAFYFHSTLGGGGGAGTPQRGRRVSGVLGLVSLVHRPTAGQGPAGIQGSGIYPPILQTTSVLAGTNLSVPLLSGMHAQKARMSPFGHSAGGSSRAVGTCTQKGTHTDACSFSSNPLSGLLTQTRTHFCTWVSANGYGCMKILREEIWVTPTHTYECTQM